MLIHQAVLKFFAWDCIILLHALDRMFSAMFYNFSSAEPGFQSVAHGPCHIHLPLAAQAARTLTVTLSQVVRSSENHFGRFHLFNAHFLGMPLAV